MANAAPHGSVVPRWQRRLLPGALLAEAERTGDESGAGAPRRSLLDWLVDIAAFMFAVALGLAVLLSTWSQHATAIAVLDVVCGSLACLALWVRRSHPWVVGVAVISVSAFSALAAGAALVSVYTVAVQCSLRRVAGITALSLAASAIYAGLYGKNGSYNFGNLLVGVLFIGVTIGWGLFARARRELVVSLNDRARRVEATQRERVEQARRAERTSIAREMHDVLAHRLSLLSVHAGALEFRPDAPPEEIERAAGVIRDSAHAALEELREVIGLLREMDADGDEGPEPPQPTLADLPALVDESRDAGMEVRLKLELEQSETIPTAIGRTVYRVVQEGLTNARKHAPGSLVDVEIGRDPDGQLTAAVVSRPRVGTMTAQAAAPPPGTGSGLVGLAERVSLAGGQLAHGYTFGGGYAVRAVLPPAP